MKTHFQDFRFWFLRYARRNSSVRYKFQIPDPEQPIPLEEQKLGPSGVLMPFKPTPLDFKALLDRPVDEVTTIVGTYGMGGPGFFGLRLGEEWLVISIWGASDWILVDGRLVRDSYYERNGRDTPWIHEQENGLMPYLIGATITMLEIQKHNLTICFSNGAVLEIDDTPERRFIHEGSKQSRKFRWADDLRDAVFLSPTAEIWV
jgi:hypothetical protein